jgi:hypothetical protein
LLHFPLAGNVVDDVEAVPSSLMFGAYSLDADLRQDVTFRSRTGREIESVEIDSVPDGFDAEPEEGVFHISGRVSGLGRQVSKLIFRCRLDGLDRPVSIAVPVAYHGLKKSTEEVQP